MKKPLLGRVRLFWLMVLAAFCISFVPAHAATTEQEISRLLWALGKSGYSAKLDNKTRAALGEFLAEQNADSDSSPEKSLELLKAAFEKKLQEERGKADTGQLTTARRIGYNPSLFFDEKNGVAVIGNLQEQLFYRLDNLRPFYSRASGALEVVGVDLGASAVIERYNDGFLWRDLFSDQQRDIALLDIGDRAVSYSAFQSSTGKFLIKIFEDGAIYAASKSAKLSLKKIGRHKKVSVLGWFEVSTGPYALSVSNDSDNNEVLVLDVENGRQLWSYAVEYAKLSPDGKLIVLARPHGKKTVLEVRETASGKILYEVETEGFQSYAMDFFDQNRKIGFLKEADGARQYVLWDIASGKLDTAARGLEYDNLYVDEARNRLIYVKSGELQALDIGTGRRIGEVDASIIDATAAALSPDRRSMAVASQGAITIVNNETALPEKRVVLQNMSGEIKALHYLSGNRILAIDQYGHVVEADLTSGSSKLRLDAEKTIDGSIDAAVISPSGRRLGVLTFDHTFVFDLESGKTLAKFKIPVIKIGAPIAFVDEESRLMLASWSTYVFDIATKRTVIARENRHYTSATEYYKGGGNFIAPVGDSPGEFWLGVSSVSAGEILSYANGKIRSLYGGGKTRTNYYAGRGSNGVVFNGRHQIISLNGKVQLNDTQTGNLIDFPQPHLDRVNKIYALDGLNKIATVGEDGEVKYYRVSGETVELLASTILFEDGAAIARTPQGFFAGSKETRNRAYVRFGLTDVHPVGNFFQSLYRPDLVAESLRGDPDKAVAEAARKLDLRAIQAEGGAPALQIVSPADNVQSASELVTVRALLTDTGGGIGRLEWRVNGITRAIQDINRARGLAPVKGTPVEATLLLDADQNVIEVVAFNSTNTQSSDTASISVRWENSGKQRKPKLFLVSIGIDDYFDSRLQLRYAKADAEGVGAAFGKAAGKLYEAVEVHLVLDQKATRPSLQKLFQKISASMHTYDVFMLYVAGHGKTEDGKYYFIPQDFKFDGPASLSANGINQATWQEWLSLIPAKKSIVMFDTCESGTLTGDTALRGGLDRLAAVDRLNEATGRSIFSAATDIGPALEGYHGHGVFAYALLSALRDADSDQDQLLEITEIASYLGEQVPKISHDKFSFRQVPQMRIVGENFPLVEFSPDLAPSAGDDAIPSRPSHVVIRVADVHEAANDNARVLMQLAAGTSVTVVKEQDGWASFARGGVLIGYVRNDALARLQ